MLSDDLRENISKPKLKQQMVSFQLPIFDINDEEEKMDEPLIHDDDGQDQMVSGVNASAIIHNQEENNISRD